MDGNGGNPAGGVGGMCLMKGVEMGSVRLWACWEAGIDE